MHYADSCSPASDHVAASYFALFVPHHVTDSLPRVPHLPTMLPSTCSFALWEMGNVIVYRIETIMCAINFLRVYLVWRLVETCLPACVVDACTSLLVVCACVRMHVIYLYLYLYLCEHILRAVV